MSTLDKFGPIFCLLRFLLVFVCAVSIPGLICAQEAGGDARKSRPDAGDKTPLKAESLTITVIVTAQKEPEPALSLPLSVTPVTDATLRDADVQAVKQAAEYAPNVFINEFTSRALSNPFFRGIGGSPTNPGVSTVIDGVPQLNSYSSNIELIDVGQIEFVRSPAGALYGRNTAGGLINIASRPLPEKWRIQAQGNLGNYNLNGFRASASSPLLKNRFGVSFGGGYLARDGYTINDFTRQDLDSREAGFGKAQVFVRLTDRLKLRWIASGENDRDGDFALGDLDYIRANPNHVNRDFAGYNRRSVTSSILIISYRGSSMDFSSNSGGVWWRNHSLTDLDYQAATFANFGLFATRDNLDRQYQFTQEFRVASSRDRAVNLKSAWNLDWQAGVFIFRQNYRQNAANDISSIFGFFPRSLSRSSADLDDWGVGVYGQARFTAWGRLDITAGLRFDYEDKLADLSSISGLQPGLSADFSEASPKFGLAYRFTPNQMTYAYVSRGYKAGGFNPPPTGVPAPPGIQSFGTEHTWNYELGHKAAWLGGRLETTAAVFYIDWRNLQLNQQIPFSGGQYYIGNAGAAFSRGVEVETRYRPFSWLELFGMAGYTCARFLQGSSAFNSNMGVNEPVGGRTLPFAPSFTANMGTQVSWNPSRRAKLYLRAQVSPYGDFQYDASNAKSQTNFTLTSFRGGMSAGRWFVEGWADNVFDVHYVPIAIPYAQLGAPSGYIGESGAPLTYGARLGIRF